VNMSELRALDWEHSHTWKGHQIETFFVNHEHRLGMVTRTPAEQTTAWYLLEGSRELASLEDLLAAVNAREVAA